MAHARLSDPTQSGFLTDDILLWMPNGLGYIDRKYRIKRDQPARKA